MTSSSTLSTNAVWALSSIRGMLGKATRKRSVFYSPINDRRLGVDGQWPFNGGVALSLPDNGFEVGARWEIVTNRCHIGGIHYSFSCGGLLQPRDKPSLVTQFILRS